MLEEKDFNEKKSKFLCLMAEDFSRNVEEIINEVIGVDYLKEDLEFYLIVIDSIIDRAIKLLNQGDDDALFGSIEYIFKIREMLDCDELDIGIEINRLLQLGIDLSKRGVQNKLILKLIDYCINELNSRNESHLDYNQLIVLLNLIGEKERAYEIMVERCEHLVNKSELDDNLYNQYIKNGSLRSLYLKIDGFYGGGFFSTINELDSEDNRVCVEDSFVFLDRLFLKYIKYKGDGGIPDDYFPYLRHMTFALMLARRGLSSDARILLSYCLSKIESEEMKVKAEKIAKSVERIIKKNL